VYYLCNADIASVAEATQAYYFAMKQLGVNISIKLGFIVLKKSLTEKEIPHKIKITVELSQNYH
jgi:hypothetical protein